MKTLSANDEKILEDILHHFKKWNVKKKDLFVGLSENPRDALFNHHKVDHELDVWIFREAESSREALKILNNLIKLGFNIAKNASPLGRFVYAYKIL